ncbi:hypothetical protein ACWDRB_61165 [Nonomuraea sp. NPDC003707]
MEDLPELAELVLGAYTLTGKLLTLLPIPIALPPISEPDGTGGLAQAQAMERARVAMQDLPLDSRVAALLNDLIIQWLIARDLCVLAVTLSPDPHRIAGIRGALARYEDLSAQAERLLSTPGQDHEPDQDYRPTRWCIRCGWSTDQPDETGCDCPDW